MYIELFGSGYRLLALKTMDVASFLDGSKRGGYVEGGNGKGMAWWLSNGFFKKKVAAPTKVASVGW